ncbi:hypothetical protein MSWAN_2240 [Methanobacterium paludis]|uniref:Uncharacterized protein n=1 Tax=Methanobacterium paludis (strain DSM 25820 / JCM 18151 / SWAN1) TaxID=868131 RepID=F6D4K8_METPW|nr:hypothetical protein MSWAN_2240 [Methanobacterium paludis]
MITKMKSQTVNEVIISTERQKNGVKIRAGVSNVV